MNKVDDFNYEKYSFDRILQLIDSTISPKFLNQTQEIVLREVWQGKTYSKIACDYNYDSEYIKTVGCNLWQLLSRSFEEQVNKNNFVPLMRRRVSAYLENSNSSTPNSATQLFSYQKTKKKCYWNAAPNTDFFEGREKELELLKTYDKGLDCRSIIISGMVGSGKTGLAIEFSKKVQEKYDRIIWNSLYNPPSAIKLINNYINIINSHSTQPEVNYSDDISFLISKLISLLKENKVLLIFDGLESILKTDKTVIYQKEFEDYAQLIRSIVSTDHQSLLICTTQAVPKSLEYYGAKQVELMQIGGLEAIPTSEIQNKSIDDADNCYKLSQLYNSVSNNPKIANIINNNLDIIDEEKDFESLISEVVDLEEIATLIEKEIEYLTKPEKEIIYWLSVYCHPINQEKLSNSLELCKSKFKLAKILEKLAERNTIEYQKSNISLMPIIKSYLRKKLVCQSLNISNID